MGLFGRKHDFDRTRILQEAKRARVAKRSRKAIELYRWLLAAEPANAEIHAELAPLLARAGQSYDAWTSFRRAARALMQDNQMDRALALYREAAATLPRNLEVWLAIAKLERGRGRHAESRAALLEGRRHLRRRSLRPQAIYLLRQLRALDPADVPASLDLAKMLASARQGHEARIILRDLAGRSHGRDLRRVRGAQWRLDPTVGHTFLWLRAALSRGESQPLPASD